MKNLKH